MSRASLTCPQAPAGSTAPSEPAGVPSAISGELAVAIDAKRRRGRGALSNATGRYEPRRGTPSTTAGRPTRSCRRSGPRSVDAARKIITRNESPDIRFDRSINPYRGCEHGCVYCFARPTHAYLGLSPGLDFETKLFAKPDAPRCWRRSFGQGL